MGKSVNATAMLALFDSGDDDGPTFKATVPRGMQTVVETLECEALVTRNLDYQPFIFTYVYIYIHTMYFYICIGKHVYAFYLPMYMYILIHIYIYIFIYICPNMYIPDSISIIHIVVYFVYT